MNLMVTEVVLDTVGERGKGSNPPQEITSKHQGYLRAPTCHTTAILWLQSRCVGNTISIVPAEHDQPLVTAR